MRSELHVTRALILHEGHAHRQRLSETGISGVAFCWVRCIDNQLNTLAHAHCAALIVSDLCIQPGQLVTVIAEPNSWLQSPLRSGTDKIQFIGGRTITTGHFKLFIATGFEIPPHVRLPFRVRHGDGENASGATGWKIGGLNTIPFCRLDAIGFPKWDVHAFFITVDDAERETGGPVLIIYPALEYRYDGQPVGWRKAQEAAIISRLCRH